MVTFTQDFSQNVPRGTFCSEDSLALSGPPPEGGEREFFSWGDFNYQNALIICFVAPQIMFSLKKLFACNVSRVRGDGVAKFVWQNSFHDHVIRVSGI